MGRNETRRWGCERETLGSLGNEMNSHCHFQIAGFGVKRTSELESPASSTGQSLTPTGTGEWKESGWGLKTLVEKGPELGRQNPSCTQKTERKNGDSSTPKSVLHYSRNGRQNPKGSNRFPSWERPMDGWVTWAQ